MTGATRPMAESRDGWVTRHLQRDSAPEAETDHRGAVDSDGIKESDHIGRVVGEVIAEVGAGAPAVAAQIRSDDPQTRVEQVTAPPAARPFGRGCDRAGEPPAGPHLHLKTIS